MKKLLMILLVCSIVTPVGSAVVVQTNSRKADAHKIAVYYKSIGFKVSEDIIEKTMIAIDNNILKYFPNGEFGRQDFIALAMLESNFHQYEVGTSGEVGIFQIMRNHIPKSIENPFAIATNTRLSMKVLKWKYQEHKDYKKAIIAYNGVVKLRKKNGAWSEKYWNAFQIRKELLKGMQIN